MRRRGLFGVSLSVFLVVAACAPMTAFPGPLPTASQSWTIQFSQTGGFAGVSLSVEVTSDGRLTAEDGRSGKMAVRQLPDEEVQHLAELLRSTPTTTQELRSSVCADCFSYDLEILRGGSRVHVRADDITLGQSEAGPLIERLQSLRDQALAGDA